MDDNRKIYTSDEKIYDTTIIEIKPEKDKLNEKNFLELDINIFEDSIDINEDIYIIQYPKYSFNLQKAAVSYGKIKKIENKYEIKHLCSTEVGSSGSPILNLSNNKVIGIHSRGYEKYNFNKGFSLKYSIEEYLNNINLINIKKHNPQDDFRVYYEIIKKIDEDWTFTYYEVIEKETGEKKAIKLFDKNRLRYYIKVSNFSEIDEEDMKPYINDLMKNIETMKIIDNENVVKYYEYFDNKEEFAIVIELCDSSLRKYFIENKMAFNINEIYDLLLQLNNTFKIMSENKIYHGNINLENIFIKEDINKKLIYKLSNNYYLGKIFQKYFNY